MILGIQFIGLIFGLVMTYMTFINHKRREFGRGQFFFWEAVWLGFIVVALFPVLVSNLAKNLGFIRTMDFLMLSGFIILAFFTFYNYSSLNRISRRLEDKTREDALREIEK